MARTPSNMMSLGTPMPSFSLPDPSGQLHSDRDLDGSRAYLVMFICNHCPFVVLVADELARLGREYQAKGVGIVAISANDVDNYPQDAPALMAQEAKTRGYSFPYLYDESQEVAKAYQAACTPDFFLFNGDRELVYRGQLDGARPENGVEVTGADLRAALDAVLAGTPVATEQRPSLGCNIKWKPTT